MKTYSSACVIWNVEHAEIMSKRYKWLTGHENSGDGLHTHTSEIKNFMFPLA
jgi:hypothetical protein